MAKISLNTMIGPVSIEERDEKIVRVGWGEVAPERTVSPVLENAADQLKAYFAERLSEFDLPIAPPGSPFQQRVWSAMCEIPHGETWTYGQLAARADTAPRAVGGACGANPIPIIIPCPRLEENGRVIPGRGGLKPNRHC